MIPNTVESVMDAEVETVTAETTARLVAGRLREPGVGSLVVVERGSVTGVVTPSDVVALVAEDRDRTAPVWTFMSAPVVTVSPEDGLADAATLMREAGVRRLPVLDGDTLVGMVTTAKLSRYLPGHRLEVEWKGVPLGERRKAVPFGD